MSIPPAPVAAPASQLETSIHCLQCTYDLIGLPEDGACPECGAHVADSYNGTLLRFSPPDYLAKLHKGVFIVQSTIIGLILLNVALAIAIVSMGATDASGVAEVVAGLITIGGYGLLAYGWWLFSEPDPKYTGVDAGDKPRQFVRAALIATIVMQLIEWVSTLILADAAASASSFLTAELIIAGLIGLLTLAAKIVMFVASMLYVKWIGARLPSRRVVDRAKRLVWLGPVLTTLGVLIIIGPLIALVLYWNLLDWVRKDLKGLRESVGTGARDLSYA